MRRPSRRGAPPSREEVEGFLAGVSHRVARASGPEARALAEELERARAAWVAGRWDEAEQRLSAIEEQMDAKVGEPELNEFPRGLVGYVPRGDRGIPTPVDDDPLANRLLLVRRLRDVVLAAGRPVDAADRLLTGAETALSAGDRAEARRRVDSAHALLEAALPPSKEE